MNTHNMFSMSIISSQPINKGTKKKKHVKNLLKTLWPNWLDKQCINDIMLTRIPLFMPCEWLKYLQRSNFLHVFYSVHISLSQLHVHVKWAVFLFTLPPRAWSVGLPLFAYFSRRKGGMKKIFHGGLLQSGNSHKAHCLISQILSVSIE